MPGGAKHRAGYGLLSAGVARADASPLQVMAPDQGNPPLLRKSRFMRHPTGLVAAQRPRYALAEVISKTAASVFYHVLWYHVGRFNPFGEFAAAKNWILQQ